MIINIETNKREICDEGTFPAVVAAVHDLGLQEGFEKGKAKHKVGVVFEVEANSGHKVLSRIYNVSLHEKSDLRKLLKACRRQDISEMEMISGQINLDEIIGKSCTIEVTHAISNGESRARVQNVSAAFANATPVEVTIDPAIEPEWVTRMKSKALTA